MFLSSSTLLFMSAPESKCDLGPDPQNWGVRYSRVASDVDVVLKRRLYQPVWRYLKRIVQLKGFFRTKARSAEKCLEISKGIADLAVYETDANPVAATAFKRRIDAGACRYLNIFAADVTGAVVETKRRVQSAIRSGFRAE